MYSEHHLALLLKHLPIYNLSSLALPLQSYSNHSSPSRPLPSSSTTTRLSPSTQTHPRPPRNAQSLPLPSPPPPSPPPHSLPNITQPLLITTMIIGSLLLVHLLLRPSRKLRPPRGCMLPMRRKERTVKPLGYCATCGPPSSLGFSPRFRRGVREGKREREKEKKRRNWRDSKHLLRPQVSLAITSIISLRQRGMFF